jgi:hypothetical protein
MEAWIAVYVRKLDIMLEETEARIRSVERQTLEALCKLRPPAPPPEAFRAMTPDERSAWIRARADFDRMMQAGRK